MALVAELMPVMPRHALAEDNITMREEEPIEVVEETKEDATIPTDGEQPTTNNDEPALGDALQVAPDTIEEQDGLLEAQAISYAQPSSRSIQDIRSYITSHPFDLTSASTYAVQPSTTSPYAAGTLSSASTQNAVNALNAMRYIAGVGYSVSNNSSYQSSAQAAALVNKVNGGLSHYPTQPSGMDNALYQLGYNGAGKSNIAFGSTNAAASIIQYLDDLGTNNSGTVGHRRWLLSSCLGQVGIGQVDNYNATYIMGTPSSSYITDVAWPARKMPTNFFNTNAQWSYATTTQNIGTASSITIRMTRRRDGKVWNLSNSQITVNEVHETGTFIGYDKNGCIVWSVPDVGGYRNGDVFDVTISGSKASKSYSVEFFDLFTVDDIAMSTYSGTVIQNGSTHEMTATNDAQRFYFLPGFSDGAYPAQPELQTIADAARESQTITYTSSNTSVATVTARGGHNSYTWDSSGAIIRLDWIADITPKGNGTTTITATLSNGVSKSFKLVVKKKSIDPSSDSNARISATSGESFTYNGQAQHPTYRVTYNGSTLIKDTDYTVTYKDDVNAGTGTATIQGIGTYAGTVQKTFTISQANLASSTVSNIDSYTYTGSTIKPTPTVSLNNRTLVAGTDYDVAYANNVNAGSATITITGKSNYKGSRTVYFTIAAAPISSATISRITDQTYTGAALTPAISITFNGHRLAEGSDYSIRYANNTNVGTATVTLTGKSNFFGTTDVSFSIAAQSLTPALISAIAAQTYTGSEIKPTPTVTLDGRTLVSGRDFFINYVNNTNVGTATVTVTGQGNYKDSKSATFTIAKAPIANATIAEIANQTFTGAAIKPVPSATYNGRKLVAGTDYDVSYAHNTNAGTATVTLTGKGDFSGSTSVSFNIAKASIADATVEPIPSQTYLGDEKTPAVNATLRGKKLVQGTDYNVSYKDNTQAGSATITLTGEGNYQGTMSVTFSIVIPFTDVTMQTGHVEDICWLYETEISRGWKHDDGTAEFRPYANVARADMAAFLFRLARRWGIVDDSWQPTGKTSFTDVFDKSSSSNAPEETAHYREIMWLAEEGISKGWEHDDGTAEFRPYANVARADMAAFLSRLFSKTNVPYDEINVLFASSDGFADVTSATAHYEDIRWLAEAGVSKGWTMQNGTTEFRPYADVARADMAAFLHRLDNLA